MSLTGYHRGKAWRCFLEFPHAGSIVKTNIGFQNGVVNLDTTITLWLNNGVHAIIGLLINTIRDRPRARAAGPVCRTAVVKDAVMACVTVALPTRAIGMLEL